VLHIRHGRRRSPQSPVNNQCSILLPNTG
jgi:hypothetical protein